MKTERVSSSTPYRSTEGSHKAELVLSGRSLSEFRDGLRIGEVLLGRVLEPLDEATSIVRFRGYNLITQSEVALPRGAQVRAEVTGLGERITMRLLEPGGSLDRAASLMERLNLPVTRDALAMIALMERAGVPITAETLQQVFARLAQLPPTRQSAELLVLSRALNVPASDAALDVLRVLSEPTVPMGERLGALGAQLPMLLPSFAAEDGETLRALGAVVAQIPLRPDAEFLSAQLRWFLHNVGVQYERSLMNGAAADASFKGMLLGARTELLQMIAALEGNGQNAAFAQTVRANIDGILRQLDASQMLARLPSMNLPHLYLHIPYWLQPNAPSPLTLEVKARKENATDNALDPDNTEIEFSVKTKRWGVIHLRFVIRDGRLRGSIEAETPEAKRRVESRLKPFIRRLTEIGYSVQGIAPLVTRALTADEPILPPIHFGDFHFLMEV